MPISILVQALVVLAPKELELGGLDHMELDHMGLEVVDMARAAMVLTLVQVCCFFSSQLEAESSISACARFCLSIVSARRVYSLLLV